jgi:tetratricopeptide (TPR) repeat protein
MSLDYRAAHLSFKRAYQVAQELADPELQAQALYDRGNTSIHSGQPSEAITALQGALTIIDGRGYPHLKGHILKLLSEAYARAHQPQECWRSVGLAESMLAQLASQPECSLFIHREFSLSALTAQKGVDADFLHDYDRAIQLIDKGLLHSRPTFLPTRARLNIQKAEAYFGLGDIDSSLFHAKDALALACSTGSNQIIARVKQLHDGMIQSKWKHERGVAHLGVLLATG